MGSPENPYKVRLDVSNFGPIAEASVELRPLTVFVGPSNTGKSYLAVLTYALQRFFSGATYNAELRAKFGTMISEHDPAGALALLHSDFETDDVEIQAEVLQKSLEKMSAELSPHCPAHVLPVEVATLVRDQIRPNRKWDQLLPGELARCFGTAGTNWLIRQGASSATKISVMSLGHHGETQTVPLAFKFGLGHQGFKSSVLVSDTVAFSIDHAMADSLLRQMRVHQSLSVESDRLPFLVQSVASSIAGATVSALVDPLSRPAHYLPADRTGIMHAHRAVVASAISSAPFAGLSDSVSLPRLSGVLSDFLLKLMAMGDDDSPGQQPLSQGLGSYIENQILAGQIVTDRSNPTYPVFSYLPKGWKTELALMNASSMVSELAPVVLFLRHVVKPGEVLIIEEPESNLHPAMQVEFMRQLAAVVNSGVRIMITTHSEWILDELANLVRLSDLPPEKRTPRLKNEPALDPRDVGVWLFERGKEDDGSRVKELPFDVNEGGFATGYEDTARLTYNQWAAIHNLLQK